ncbi:hypothetical protein AB0L75_24215 [Streptomyces sp. NPDC052101]|uniref:hypothetical protein n=1 Tax=Streptomyces sp. NPDC052101 TaxID=3155763 RepID=UPI00342B3A48
MTVSSRNGAFYQQFLQKVETADPAGDIYAVIDNLSSDNSVSTRTWLEDHPRIRSGPGYGEDPHLQPASLVAEQQQVWRRP